MRLVLHPKVSSSLLGGGLEPGFRVLFSTIFLGIALENRQLGRKRWKAVEAKLLQTAASLRTVFVLVMFAEALRIARRVSGGILERWMPKSDQIHRSMRYRGQ